MIDRLFKYCRFGAIWLALACLLDAPAHAGAYLPLIGPPPLRFQLAMVREKKIYLPPPVATVAPPVFVKTNPPATVNVTNSQIHPAAPQPAVVPTNAVVSVPVESLAQNSTPPSQSANDLLVVTPEMLVDYFKPKSDATNSTNVRVLVPVNFTPPTTVSTPSSQAIYRSP